MNPYEGLESAAFWKTAIADREPSAIGGMARPKHRLSRSDRIGTAGSCFAQHMTRHLRGHGFTFVDAEPAPELLPAEMHARYGFGVYSARYGNIYTAGQLRQTIERAAGRRDPTDSIWRRNDRFFDAFRPHVEPNGFASAEEVAADRASHMRCIRSLFGNIDVLVLTLGLTEAWRSKEDGSVYPMAPGVQGIGTFDPDKHEFVNFGFKEVYQDLAWSFAYLKKINPAIRFIVTVSPVPLAASRSGEHVLVATTYSKAVLRTAAEQLRLERDDVDYFPSYEMIATPPFRGVFFEPGMREVSEAGVTYVMQSFVREFCTDTGSARDEPVEIDSDDVVCEERILEFYARAST